MGWGWGCGLRWGVEVRVAGAELQVSLHAPSALCNTSVIQTHTPTLLSFPQGTLRPLCRFSPPQRDPTPIATTTAIANPTTTAPAPNTATPAPPRPLIGKLRIPMLGKRKAEGGEAGASNGAAAAGVTGGVAAASE